MEPDDLKMAIMQLKTKKGDIIRQYYIDLEKLLKLYASAFNVETPEHGLLRANAIALTAETPILMPV